MADSSNSSATSSTSSQSTGSQSTGSQASTSGKTTSNSTGNFSGGLPGLGGGSWSSPSSETAAAHASGVQGPGLANGNFGSSWSGNGNSGSGSGDYTYNNTSYSNNKSEPVMTVDEVYGKIENAGNQSIVEGQGDYAASSNEKSSVETSTFGKQDNITVTPESVTENKGLVDNAAIDSIEGINFQQKDKESQDVMEARKSRDDAESEDKANQMRESLKAKTDLTVDEDAVSKFQIGDRDEEVAAMAQDLQGKITEAQDAAATAKDFNAAMNTWQAYQEGKDVNEAEMGKAARVFSKYGLDKVYDGILEGGPFGVSLEGLDAEAVKGANEQFLGKAEETFNGLMDACAIADKAAEQAQQAYDSVVSSKYVAAAKTKADEAKKAHQDVVNQINDIHNKEKQMNNNVAAAKEKLEEADARYKASIKALAKVTQEAEAKGIINAETARNLYKGTITNEELDSINWGTMSENAESTKAEFREAADESFEADRAYKAAMEAEAAYLEKAYPQLEQLIAKQETLADEFQAAYADYNSMINEKFVGAEEAPAVTPESKAITTENTPSDTKQAFDNAIQNAVEKGADEQTVQAMTDIAASIEGTKTEMQKAIAENDIPTYVEAQKQYNKNLNEALEIGNRLTQTDFNKDFVAAVAKANDFEVTLADGTKTTYSQFATDMATKSPEVAKAMYEAKAQKYEAENHPVLAKIERAKAEMVGTWLGSKLTQADNQVRGQFNQMAKTNMRATYAAYNNVLSDPNASPEAKAEASAAINQANGLMTASAALQASTGFLSGIGDSMKDGVYGVTDPAALNAYQKTLNAIDNFAKITLGLGVTPGANKAYQNMYYMAGAKVGESGLFSKDFDSDGFALCQEYGNNAAAGMIAGAGELATGIALFFNPAMSGIGLNLVIDSIQTFTNGLYGVQKDARKAEKYTQEVLSYFKEAESIAAETGNKEALDAISSGITQIENFELKSDEVGNLDNWLEGSGSNTATNEKFNQSLSYDEWLKLIEADPTMRDYAKKLIAEKKEK